MVTLCEVQTELCEVCGGEKEIRVLMGSLGQTIRVTRCKTGGCLRAKARSEAAEVVGLAN